MTLGTFTVPENRQAILRHSKTFHCDSISGAELSIVCFLNHYWMKEEVEKENKLSIRVLELVCQFLSLSKECCA